jgi:hypothetical protein
MIATLKVSYLSPVLEELQMTKMRVTLQAPMPPEEVTVQVVRDALKKADIMTPAVRAALYFKDEEGEFLTLPNPKEAWPSCCVSDNLARVWIMWVPNPPSELVCTCLGPHKHLPDKKKLETVDYDGFKGYSLLAAAGDACHSCVEHWLDDGVDANFVSDNQQYTPMDCVLWAEKKSKISMAAAERVKELLKASGGEPNKMAA